jgi:hypothetical protein
MNLHEKKEKGWVEIQERKRRKQLFEFPGVLLDTFEYCRGTHLEIIGILNTIREKCIISE